MTLLSIGVRPESVLASDAGLPINDRGGIQVNEFMQTTDPNIYAIGDAIEVKDFVLQSQAFIPLAGPANRQGRLVADHIYGKTNSYKGTLGSSIAKVFDLTVAATVSTKTSQAGECTLSSYPYSPSSHAGYYPGVSHRLEAVIPSGNRSSLWGASDWSRWRG